MHHALPVAKILVRRIAERAAGDGFEDAYKLFRVLVRQWLDQRCIYNSEDCGARAETEGKHKSCGDSEAWVLDELSERELKIASQIVEPYNAIAKMKLFLSGCPASELDVGVPACLLIVEAFLLQLVGLEFEVSLELLLKVLGTPPGLEHGSCSSMPDFCFDANG